MDHRRIAAQLREHLQGLVRQPGDAGEQGRASGADIGRYRRKGRWSGEIDGNVRHPADGIQICDVPDIDNPCQLVAGGPGGLLDGAAHAAISNQ